MKTRLVAFYPVAFLSVDIGRKKSVDFLDYFWWTRWTSAALQWL